MLKASISNEQKTNIKSEYKHITIYKLPTTLIQQICEYDPTYKDMFGQVLIQLNMHCFIYRCNECYRHYNNCYC